ncbi:MAG: 6-pyruvoyl-tetrahydropterin synthase-related protein, partial [Candidatus Altiarchaeota archaeon]
MAKPRSRKSKGVSNSQISGWKNNILVKNWSTLATFLIIYFFILQSFGVKPFEKSLLEIPFLNSLLGNYMLTKTTTTGGDLGSHWVLAQYLRDYLVPTGRLVGWYPHWMGGLPLFQYYFVPPYFLMVLLSPLLTLEVAFKLVSAAWIFFTPIAFYYAAKGLGFEKPGPEIAAALSLALTWLETVTGGNYAQWGGNVKSAMAGQFPYGISLAFAVMCIGLLWEGYHSKKHIVLNAILFSMVVLHHLYTIIAIGLVSTFFLIHALRTRKFDGAFYLAKVFILGFMIAGFWLIPSYAKLDWSMPPRDVFYGFPSMDWIFIQEYSIFYLMIILG